MHAFVFKMAFFKTFINVGKNICSDFKLPVKRSVEIDSKLNYEVRIYEKNKYVVFKYRTIDKRAVDLSKTDKKPDDKVMEYVWKLMKYTQGENDQNKTMKLLMPVFVFVTVLPKEKKEGSNYDDEIEDIEIRLMISLPSEYQYDAANPDKQVLEAPKPTDETLYFETLDEFKCYVRLVFKCALFRKCKRYSKI